VDFNKLSGKEEKAMTDIEIKRKAEKYLIQENNRLQTLLEEDGIKALLVDIFTQGYKDSEYDAIESDGLYQEIGSLRAIINNKIEEIEDLEEQIEDLEKEIEEKDNTITEFEDAAGELEDLQTALNVENL
jgi:septal ring factor EnvC (AmiA/AmiB activator)